MLNIELRSTDGAPPRPVNARDRKLVALALIVALGVALRVASALFQGDQVTILPGIYDQVSYHNLAIRVLQGHGFSFGSDWWPATRAGEPTAHWSFLYTLYLVGVYLIAGIHPLAARLIQAVLAGVLQPVLTWRIGKRLFGSRVGLIAAALSAVYVYFFYYGGALMTETFYILAILWALDLVTSLGGSDATPSLRRPRSWLPWLALGLAFGAAALLRQLILFVVPIALAWMLLVRRERGVALPAPERSRRLTATALGMAISLVVVAALIAPWTIRNERAFGRFVLLNTNDGYVFFWANHPIYGTNFIPILSDQEYQQLIPSNLRGLDEAALNDALLRQGIGFVIADPVRYALLSISRIKSYFEFWPSADSGLASNLARTLSFGVLMPFMIAGLYLSVRGRRTTTPWRWRMLQLMYVLMASYTAIHLLTWALVRYRLPVDAILILFAARAIDPVLARVFKTSGWRLEPGHAGGPERVVNGALTSNSAVQSVTRDNRVLGKS